MPGPSAPLSPAGALVRARDPDRFLCALFAPAGPRREAMFALAAYNHELARAREAARTPLIALMRLQWWRDAVADAAAGKPPRRHEVAGPLHAAIAVGALDPADLLAMADAREAEAEGAAGLPGAEAFRSYLRGTAGAHAVAAGRLLGAPPAALPPLQQAGAAYGLAGVLRSVAALARQGRCLLPADALDAAGTDAAAVIADPAGDASRAAIRALAAEGLPAAEAAARSLRGGRLLPRQAVAAALPLVLARRDLRRLRAGRGAAQPAEADARGVGDRLAVIAAGLRGRV